MMPNWHNIMERVMPKPHWHVCLVCLSDCLHGDTSLDTCFVKYFVPSLWPQFVCLENNICTIY